MTDARIIHGDCRQVLAELPEASVDVIVTDPPYEIAFMGKGWDAAGVAFDPATWAECLRVLKPGGHLLAFGATRTYHRMAVAIEDAGFEIRDSIHWLYGSGFPKSLDVSKAIDKAAGAEREVTGPTVRGAQSVSTGRYSYRGDGITPTAPATDAARQWEGWGTALKPAHEPIIVARKPFVGTVAANVIEHGTGALNIGGTRVGNERLPAQAAGQARVGTFERKDMVTPERTGRWPANLVLTHHADCEQIGTATDTYGGGAHGSSGFVHGYDGGGFVASSTTVGVWRCAHGCPVAELDAQSGVSKSPAKVTRGAQCHGSFSLGRQEDVPCHNDTGGASRFFTVTDWDPTADAVPFQYVAKPSRRERNAGLDGLPEAMPRAANGSPNAVGETRGSLSKPRANTHPTVKPVALMRWLVRLVTPPGGTVLDPFTGSGTTAVAAILEQFNFIGCELTDDYLPIIEGRIEWAHAQTATEPTAPAPKPTPTPATDAQPSLFNQGD